MPGANGMTPRGLRMHDALKDSAGQRGRASGVGTSPIFLRTQVCRTMLTHDDHRYALVMQRVLRATDLGDHREAILAAAEARGVRHVRVFGSVARGGASGSSDVDLLVDLERGRSLLDLGAFLMDVQDLLGCPVDVVTEAGLKPRLRDRVLSEAVLA